MVIRKSELGDFARFLVDEFQAQPMLRTGDDGELLRAVFANRLLLVLDLDSEAADVWCSDENALTEIWSAWRSYRAVAS